MPPGGRSSQAPPPASATTTAASRNDARRRIGRHAAGAHVMVEVDLTLGLAYRRAEPLGDAVDRHPGESMEVAESGERAWRTEAAAHRAQLLARLGGAVAHGHDAHAVVAEYLRTPAVQDLREMGIAIPGKVDLREHEVAVVLEQVGLLQVATGARKAVRAVCQPARIHGRFCAQQNERVEVTVPGAVAGRVTAVHPRGPQVLRALRLQKALQCPDDVGATVQAAQQLQGYRGLQSRPEPGATGKRRVSLCNDARALFDRDRALHRPARPAGCSDGSEPRNPPGMTA